MTRLLLTGGSGYLGQHLTPLAMAAARDVVYTYFQNDPLHLPQGKRLDVRDKTAVSRLVADFQPTAVIHAAGSNRTPDMESVIVQGAANIVAAAQTVGARLVHLSTDVIFDGTAAPYTEQAPPQPMHAYGKAKADAETIVAAYADSAIVRTSLIYGLQQMDVGTRWMTDALRNGEPVTLFSDQYRNPVWVETLGRACLELALESDYRGILNVAGRQKMSRAEFGLRMLAYWGITERENLTITPAPPGRWPADCTLDVGKAAALLAAPLLGVDEVLSDLALLR